MNKADAAPKPNDKASKKKRNKKIGKPALFFFGFLSVIVLTVLTVVSYMLIHALMFIHGDIVVDLDERKANQNQTSFMYAYDENGKTVEIARLHGREDRVWVDLDDMSPYMKDAFIALEDARFEKHRGVDWIRTIGVLVKPQNLGQGGSTITQQLIKNLTNKKEVTIIRKYYEILTALNLEANYDKDVILEAYLNTVYLGGGCYGVKTASEKYFGKDVGKLNAAECAVLASITQNPSKNNPLLKSSEYKKRQEYCLKLMRASGALTPDEYTKAKDFKLIFTNDKDYVPKKDKTQIKKEDEEKINSFYVDYVRECVRRDLMEEYGYSKQKANDMILYGGLKIYSAVDLKIQGILEDVYVNRKSFPKLKSKGVRNKNGVRVGKKGVPVQSAMTIMDYSGRVVAIVGEAGEKTGKLGLNRAADAYRQPGSTIKPLATYAPAIDMNIYNYSSKVRDYAVPILGRLWPHNVDGSLGSGNNVTIEYAIKKSLNTVPVRIIKNDLGTDASFDFLRDRFHLSKLDEKEDRKLSPLATGALTHGATTVEMASAYAAFGNGGLYYQPYSYYKVTNSQGTKILLSNESPKFERAISEETSDIVCELLQTVDTSYYGKAPNVRKFQIMAKTGTTSDNRDRWFCAGTPYYVASVWLGFDRPEPLDVSINPCGKIFMTVFDRIHKGLDDKKFPKSKSVVKKRYCRATGKIAGPNCASTGVGWYKITNMPSNCSYCKSAPAPVPSKPAQAARAENGRVADEAANRLEEILNEALGEE